MSQPQRTAMVCGKLCIAPENDYFVTCSFDKNHVVLRSRLPYHIVKCKAKHQNHKKVQCPYDACEYIEEKDLAEHILTCKAQRSIYTEKFEAGRMQEKQFKVNVSLLKPTPYVHKSAPVCDEDWGPSGNNDDEDDDDVLVGVGRGVNVKLNNAKSSGGRGRGRLVQAQAEKEAFDENRAFTSFD